MPTFLSPHFTLQDLVRSDTAVRLGIDNTPTEPHLNNLKLVCQHILEPVYAHYVMTGLASHVRINSGYRSLALNLAINPLTTTLTKLSQHCKGQAVDFEIDGVSNVLLAEWCRDNLGAYDQLILEYYVPGQLNSGWVHGSYVQESPRRQCLTAVKVNGKTEYQSGINA
jgi:zinc D-Ala-D-Ala carboxypeptidase